MFDFLPNNIANQIKSLNLDNLNEIRLRLNIPILIKYNFKKHYLSDNGLTFDKNKAIVTTKEIIDYVIETVSEKSLYAHNERLKNGYLITKEGIRIGIAGECVFDGQVKTIKNITSLLIRIPYINYGELDKISKFIYDGNVYNTLIISPPGYGKTTLIKKIIKFLSEYKDLLVIDERGELYDKNINVDYIRFSNKQYAFEKGVRVMSPQVIVTDEIITENDYKMCEFIANSGIKIIATIHAKDYDEVVNKAYFNKNTFDRYIILNNKEKAGDILYIYDRHNGIIYE